jgi:hypothetical protein
VFKLVFPLVFLLLSDGQGKDEAPKMSGLFKTPPTKSEIEASRKKPPELEEKRPPKRTASSAARTERLDREVPGGEGNRALGRAGAMTGERGPTESERVVSPAVGITAGAMHEELGQHAGGQKSPGERERLEALSADLARARAALREETARLEGLMDKAKQAGVIKPGAPGAPAPAAGNGENAGPATMPIGDPLAPSAYFRPAPPPPNFAVQVEVVSKAIKSMKPEQAAGVIGHLERGLAAEVLQRMRSDAAGAILGFLKPEIAAALAAEIVSRPPIGSKNKDADKEKP